MADDIESDVVIVGSGISGAIMASKLAAAGIKVAILEAGDDVDRSDAVDKYWNAAIKVPSSAYPLSPEVMHPVANDLDFWYDQTGPDPFSSTYIKVVGGTTWHWLGTCLRLLPNDFELKTKYGKGADWPITYDELETYYAAAEKEIGVAGDSADDLGAPRTTDYPMPEIPMTYLDKQIAAAVQDEVYKVRSTPQGRLSVDQDTRPACCGNSSCIPVCPVQAKYDATIHVDMAVASGAVVHKNTTAVSIELGADRKIERIHFKRPDGSEGSAKGKYFVLAAHAIETPRLLLNSISEASPNGVANSSDQVGRNLMDHPTQLSWALAKEPLYPYRGPLATSGIENLRDGSFRKDRGAFRIEIGNDGWSWPTGAPITTAQELADKGLSGDKLDAALYDKSVREYRLASLVEQLPDPENRITLNPVKSDMYGVGVPTINYRIDDYTKAGFKASVDAHNEIFAAMGSTQINHGAHFEGAGHIIGTTVMGTDDRTSVVDQTLKSHDHDNLYILGSSVFPTSGTANPTLTIAALALRASDALKARLG